MATVEKYSKGYVKQTFNEKGDIVDQEFVCDSDPIEIVVIDAKSEKEEKELSFKARDFYYPFDMKIYQNSEEGSI
jgi:hypothetical protein